MAKSIDIPVKTKQMFSEAPEGHYCEMHTRDVLLDLYAQQDADTQQLLAEQPVSASDYINRFVFWTRASQSLSIDEQYNIVHQLIRAYAVHATLTDYHKAYRLVPDKGGAE